MKRRFNIAALGLFFTLAQVSTLHAADTGAPAPVTASPSKPAPTPTPSATLAPSATPTPSATPLPAVDELATSRALIAAKKFPQALVELKRVDRIVTDSADVNNLLGFVSRKLGQYSQASGYYEKALKINPNHLGALEYQGELYLAQRKVTQAKQNLLKLQRLCGTSCEQYLDLKQAIALSTKKK